jgi:hypothetical protein
MKQQRQGHGSRSCPSRQNRSVRWMQKLMTRGGRTGCCAGCKANDPRRQNRLLRWMQKLLTRGGRTGCCARCKRDLPEEAEQVVALDAEPGAPECPEVLRFATHRLPSANSQRIAISEGVPMSQPPVEASTDFSRVQGHWVYDFWVIHVTILSASTLKPRIACCRTYDRPLSKYLMKSSSGKTLCEDLTKRPYRRTQCEDLMKRPYIRTS